MAIRWRWLVAVFMACAVIVAGCGGDDDDDTASDASTTTTADLSGDVVVFAATSLTDVFTELGRKFMVEHPDVTVMFNFAASSELATQIEEASPADVFASADEPNMTKAVDAGAVVGDPVVFVKNELQIVVEKGNPKAVSGLEDLSNGDLIVALCAPEVPCGNYAAQAFEQASLPLPTASQEQNVRAVVERVAMGEADAGIAYKTDVLVRSDDVDGVEIPDDQNVIASYPAAVLDIGSNEDAGAAWVAFLQTPDALAVLTRAGFLAP